MEQRRGIEHKTLQDHMISYSVQRATLDNLLQYAYPTDYGTAISAREIDLGSSTACSSLQTVEGMVSLHKWFNAFSKCFTLMAKFDAQVKNGIPFNHADWRLMDESVTKAFDMLRTKLEEITEQY